MLISNSALKIVNFVLTVLIRELAGPLIDLKCGSKHGAATFATQSFQRCRLENVADMSYVTVTEFHFWIKFSKF